MNGFHSALGLLALLRQKDKFGGGCDMTAQCGYNTHTLCISLSLFSTLSYSYTFLVFLVNLFSTGMVYGEVWQNGALISYTLAATNITCHMQASRSDESTPVKMP